MDSQACTVHRLISDVCLVAEGQVLLVRYHDVSKYDGQTGWFLPDDYLTHLEHPDEAAVRIVRQQVGVVAPPVALSHIESFGNGVWHIVFHYRLELPAARPVPVLGNVKAVQWFPLGGLPEPEQVGHHGWALHTIRKVLSGE